MCIIVVHKLIYTKNIDKTGNDLNALNNKPALGPKPQLLLQLLWSLAPHGQWPLSLVPAT